MSQCMQDLRKAGQAYPRTCAECGLGPCKRYPPEKPVAASRRELDAVKKAEEAIGLALIALEAITGKSIDTVSVDTRNFAQLSTEIWLTTTRRR